MFRSILLGKLGLSIAASMLVGSACLTQPWRNSYTLSQTTQWISIGIFFLLLGIGQLIAIYFLFRKKQFSSE